jgi:fumarate reductase subunit D
LSVLVFLWSDSTAPLEYGPGCAAKLRHMSNSASLQRRSNMNAKTLLVLTGLVGLGFFGLPLVTYFVVFHGTLSQEPANWGLFGDYVGGLSTALLSFLSLLALLFTIHVQGEELRKSTAAQLVSAEVGRLTALKLLQTYYLEHMQYQDSVARDMKGLQAAQLASARYAELDAKLREVSRAIEEFHPNVLERGAA